MADPNPTDMFKTATSAGTEMLQKFARAAADTQTNMLNDFTKRFAELKFPTAITDNHALMAAHRRNMEALAAANKLAMEGAHAVARRNMEIMQQTLAELSTHVRELASADSPQTKAARQAELVKKSYEHAVANIKELSDLIQRSNAEAVSVLNGRVQEAMEEVQSLLEKAGEKSP
jgi:phasin family protein